MELKMSLGFVCFKVRFCWNEIVVLFYLDFSFVNFLFGSFGKKRLGYLEIY